MASKDRTKKQQAQQAKNDQALATVSGLSLSSVLGALTQTSLKTQSTFAGIQEELIAKFNELQAIETAIKVKKEEIHTLHNIDTTLMNLDEIKAQHQQALEEMEKERSEKQASFDEQFRQLEQAREREEEEYKYNLAQKRKLDQDQWLEQVRTNQNNERDRQEKFNKDISSREEALSLKEKSYNEALTKAATFDADLKKAVDSEVAKTAAAIKREYEHKTEIANVQHTAEMQKLSYENQRLLASNTALEVTVKELQASLKQAYEKNNELAAKAVDSAANTKQVADLQSLITNVGGNGTRART